MNKTNKPITEKWSYGIVANTELYQRRINGKTETLITPSEVCRELNRLAEIERQSTENKTILKR